MLDFVAHSIILFYGEGGPGDFDNILEGGGGGGVACFLSLGGGKFRGPYF